MDPKLEKPDDRSISPQKNYVSPMGPGQLVYTNFNETQNKADSENFEKQKENVNEMKTKIEPNEKNNQDIGNSGNDLERDTEAKAVTFNERVSAGYETEKMAITQNETSILQEQSSSIQGTIEEVDTILNPDEGDVQEEYQLALSPRQAKGLASMLMSKSIVEASRTSGIPERTLRRWITDPNFKLAFREEIEKIKQAYLLETLSLLGPSLQARRDLLENPTQPGAAIKEKVADKTIKSCEKSLEMLGTEERIERLERLVRKHV